MINTLSYKIPLIHQLQMQYVSFHFQNWKLFLRSEGFKHLCVEKLTIMNKDRDWKKTSSKVKIWCHVKVFYIVHTVCLNSKKILCHTFAKIPLNHQLHMIYVSLCFQKKNKFKGERTSSICVHHCLNATTLCLKQNYFWSEDH